MVLVLTEKENKSGDLVYTMLDGSKEERMKMLRQFLGLKEGQTFQDIKVNDDDEE